MHYTITGGRVLDPANQVDACLDVHLAGGKIAGLGPAPEGFVADITIDASQCWVCPGLVDLGVRLREPGESYKATIRSETRAAAANGITTVCVPPDTDPVLDTPAVADLILRRAQESGQSRVLPIAALTRGLRGEHLTEMGELRAAGCIGVSNAQQPVANTQVLRRALQYAANFALPVFVQPQDPWLGRSGLMHEGRISTRLGLAGIPVSAETIEVARMILLVEETGAHVHFCRLSTARAVELVSDAQARGLPITADVAIHQLFLTESDMNGFNTESYTQPPLRTENDRDALRAGVMSGVIQAICSDHQPHEPDAKLAPLGEACPGISSVDTLLPLSLKLSESIGVDWEHILPRLTTGPAQVVGKALGTLQSGGSADLFILNPRAVAILHAHDLLSQGKNTPFLGWELPGRVSHAWVGGRLVASR